MQHDTQFIKAQNAAHSGAFGFNPMKTPTIKMQEAGNYKKGSLRIFGLDIAIENPAGTYRDEGKSWRVADHYGYIKGVVGADGDNLDCFVGSNLSSNRIFVINQKNRDGSFDEHKAMIGYDTPQQAILAYQLSYEQGWHGLHSIVPMSVKQFKFWLDRGNKANPVSSSELPIGGDYELPSTLSDLMWTDNEPNHAIDNLLIAMRRMNAHGEMGDLLVDPVDMDDLTQGSEQVVMLDALVSAYGKLKLKMVSLQKAMARKSELADMNAEIQISEPFKRYGSLQVSVLFTLTDGQTVAIFFHNPDTTPNKITPQDSMVSWKWMLNKKDVTIVVAPESGQDISVNEVAMRIMKLAEKNAPLFAKAQARKGERVESIKALRDEVKSLESREAELIAEIEKRKAGGGSGVNKDDLESEKRLEKADAFNKDTYSNNGQVDVARYLSLFANNVSKTVRHSVDAVVYDLSIPDTKTGAGFDVKGAFWWEGKNPRIATYSKDSTPLVLSLTGGKTENGSNKIVFSKFNVVAEGEKALSKYSSAFDKLTNDGNNEQPQGSAVGGEQTGGNIDSIIANMRAVVTDSPMVYDTEQDQHSKYVVMRATRPLVGAETMQANGLLGGGFWALIDRNDEFAANNAETNKKLDATIHVAVKNEDELNKVALYFVKDGKYFDRYVESISQETYNEAIVEQLKTVAFKEVRTYSEMMQAIEWAKSFNAEQPQSGDVSGEQSNNDDSRVDAYNIDDTDKGYIKSYLAESKDLISKLDAAGIAYPSKERFMDEVNSGNRIGATIQSIEQNLKKYKQDLVQVQSGSKAPRSVIGTGGTKKAAIAWLENQIAMNELAMESNGFIYGANLRNYNSTLRSLLKGGQDDVKTSEQLAQEQAEKDAYRAKVEQEQAELTAKANASKKYEVGTDAGMRNALNVTYNIPNTMERVLVELAEKGSPDEMVKYLDSKLESGVTRQEAQFNKRIELNGAIRDGAKWQYVKVEPRVGYVLVNAWIDLSATGSNAYQQPTEQPAPVESSKPNKIDFLVNTMKSWYENNGMSLEDIYKKVKQFYPLTSDASVIFHSFIKSEKEKGNQKLMDEFNKSSFIENINGAKSEQPAPVEPEPIVITGKELGDFPDTEEGKKALRSAVKDHLMAMRGDWVNCPILSGKVEIRNRGIKETLARSGDPRKLKILSSIKKIIGQAFSRDKQDNYKASEKPDVIGYYHLKSSVRLEGDDINLDLVIEEDKNGLLHYDVIIDKSSIKKALLDSAFTSPKTLPDNYSGFCKGHDLTLSNTFDSVNSRMVINLFIEGEEPEYVDDEGGSDDSSNNVTPQATQENKDEAKNNVKKEGFLKRIEALRQGTEDEYQANIDQLADDIERAGMMVDFDEILKQLDDEKDATVQKVQAAMRAGLL